MESQICPGCGACIGEDEWFCPFCDWGLDDDEEDLCPHGIPFEEDCKDCDEDEDDNDNGDIAPPPVKVRRRRKPQRKPVKKSRRSKQRLRR